MTTIHTTGLIPFDDPAATESDGFPASTWGFPSSTSPSSVCQLKWNHALPGKF